MRVLVVGGSRFIGLHVVRELLRRGHDVLVFNRGNNNHRLPAKVKTLIGDRRDPDSLAAALSSLEVDAVVDMCAYTREDTARLLEVLPRSIRFLHASSGAVYRLADRFPIDESFPLGPDPDEGDYGLNKIAIEELLREKQREGLRVTILRPGYVYGPDNYLYRESRFFERLETGRPILVPGSGEVLTQCVYVKDVAWAFAECLERENTIGEVYNILQKHAYTLKGYLNAVFQALGRSTPIITFDPYRLGLTKKEIAQVFPFRWQHNVVRSIAKAECDLGFRPVSLAEGMRETYLWWKQYGVRRQQGLELEDRILARLREQHQEV